MTNDEISISISICPTQPIFPSALKKRSLSHWQNIRWNTCGCLMYRDQLNIKTMHICLNTEITLCKARFWHYDNYAGTEIDRGNSRFMSFITRFISENYAHVGDTSGHGGQTISSSLTWSFEKIAFNVTLLISWLTNNSMICVSICETVKFMCPNLSFPIHS